MVFNGYEMCLLWGGKLIFKDLYMFCNPKQQIILTPSLWHEVHNLSLLWWGTYLARLLTGGFIRRFTTNWKWLSVEGQAVPAVPTNCNVFVFKGSSSAGRTAKYGLLDSLGGGNTIPRNVENHSPNDKTLHARRHESSCQVPCLLRIIKQIHWTFTP